MEAPGLSADWYRAVTEFAHGTPGWVHAVAEFGTDAGLLVFAALFVAAAWRARRREPRAMALALLAPVATIGAYLTSETIKSILAQERPCRAVAGAVAIAPCPSPGDWSFPSNHATIAAASAAVIVVAWRRWAMLVLPLAAVMAFSRVFVGVHYPHDVAAGFLLGVTVAPLLAIFLAGPLTPVIAWLRHQSGPAPAGTPASATDAPPPEPHESDMALTGARRP